jgi:hypothetical protein
MDMTLCNLWAANYPEAPDLSTATCAHCPPRLRKILKGAA